MITNFKLDEDEIVNAIVSYIRNNYKTCYLNKFDNATLVDMCELNYNDVGKIEAEFTINDRL